MLGAGWTEWVGFLNGADRTDGHIAFNRVDGFVGIRGAAGLSRLIFVQYGECTVSAGQRRMGMRVGGLEAPDASQAEYSLLFFSFPRFFFSRPNHAAGIEYS